MTAGAENWTGTVTAPAGGARGGASFRRSAAGDGGGGGGGGGGGPGVEGFSRLCGGGGGDVAGRARDAFRPALRGGARGADSLWSFDFDGGGGGDGHDNGQFNRRFGQF